MSQPHETGRLPGGDTACGVHGHGHRGWDASPACREFSILDVAAGPLTPLPVPVATQPKATKGGPVALGDSGTRLACVSDAEGKGFKVSHTDLTSIQTTEIATTVSTDLGSVQIGDEI